MSTTRTTVMQRIIQELGGHYGSISSGTATTAVLAGLLGISSDTNEFVGWKLLMPDAATAVDQEREITAWAGSTGTATFATRADTNYTGETYLLLPSRSYTLTQIRNAINDVMRQQKRSVKVYLPTMNQRREYPLTALSWLRGPKDVDGVAWRVSNNHLDNEDFSKWQNGPAAAPDGWVLAGSGATIARDTSYALNGYSAKIVTAAVNATLTYTITFDLAWQLANTDGSPAKIEFGGWGQAATASTLRFGCSDGVTTTYTAYHSGGGALEWLSTTKTISASTTNLQFVVSIEGANKTVYVARAAQCEGSILQQIRDYGSEAFSPQPCTYDVQMVGGVSTLIIPGPFRRGLQIIVTSRRPYAEFAADSDTSDCSEEVMYHGALYQLASIHRQGEDRTRLDVIAQLHGNAYRELADVAIDLPLRRTRAAYVTTGA